MRAIALTQGIYYLGTGIWPLAHIRSFLKVTGPKTDLWLVKTLVSAAGAAILVAGARNRRSAELDVLALGSAVARAAVDVNYAGNGVFSRVYLADAAVEAGLAAAWIAARRRQRTSTEKAAAPEGATA